MKAGSNTSFRTSRVGEEIRSRVARYLLTEVQMDGGALINITAVTMTKDLSIARIYYTVLDEERRKETEVFLNKITSSLRSHIAQELSMRRTPTLEFRYDEVQTRADRMEELLTQIKKP